MSRRHDDLNALGRWRSRNQAALLLIALLLGMVLAVGCCVPRPAHASDRYGPIAVPDVATLYRIKIERAAARQFGVDAPIARLAAQIHQESAWRPRAASAYAHGLAQFTPATAAWLPQVCPAVGKPDAWDPDWSLRAQACYMRWLYDRVEPMPPGTSLSSCSHWAFALRAYNGGMGWVQRERVATRKAGDNPNDWSDVARHRVRAKWAHRENTEYPRRILLRIEPAYIAAGWPGSAVC